MLFYGPRVYGQSEAKMRLEGGVAGLRELNPGNDAAF